jgi:putative membrane protein
MTDYSLDKPQRQSAIGSLFFFIYSVQKFLRGFWPLILIYVFKGDASRALNSITAYVGIGLALIMIVNSVLSWFNFYFFIKDDEFVVRKGYLKRIVVAVPMEKIVSVNIKQGIFHQILGVVQLEIDSAGSKTKEVSIPAISIQIAKELQSRLQQGQSKFATEEATQENGVEEQSVKKGILWLSFEDLLRVGITQNHLRGLALVAAFGYNIFQGIKDVFKSEVDMVAEKTGSFIEHSNTIVLTVVVVFLVIVSFLISMIDTWLRYYDFKMIRQKNTFTISSGLLKKKTITIPFSRVQMVIQSINPLQKWAGISTCKIKQANSTEQTNNKDQIFTTVPGCSSHHFNEISKSLLGNWQENEFLELKPDKVFAYRIFFISLLVFGLPIAAISLVEIKVLWGLTGVIPLAFLIAWGIYRRRKFAINRDYAKVYSGFVGTDLSVLELYKVQTVRIKQTIFQRRKNTANIRLVMAGGSISFKYIPMSDAIRIKDYILYQVISTPKDWM